MPTLTPIVSASVFNSNVASSNSWVNVSNDDNRPLFALATFDVTQDKAADIVSDTNIHAGNYTKIVTITSTVFTAITGSISGSVATITFPANFVIDSPVSAFQLTSGSVIAYK